MTTTALRDDAFVAPLPSPEQATRRILLVDAKPDTFKRLKDAMRPSGPEWQVEFAAGGEDALRVLAADPADVVITDEQLPLMDGVALLAQVRDRYPATIRMILSARATPGLATIVSHRLLPKPCDIVELQGLIKRSCALRTRTSTAEAHRKTVATAALPSRPGVYMELNQILSDPSWEPAQVSAVIERDVAMSAKVLQLANSALLGLTSTVSSTKDAVMYLGVETIRSLALTAEAFGKLTARGCDGLSLDEFQAHATLVARITSAILPRGRAQQEAATAALLHDIGKLVIAADGTHRWSELNRQATERGVALHEVELETEGVTHADVGAHLLSLWGLPDAIVEAVAHHHEPVCLDRMALDGVADAMAAVHIANGLANELAPARPGGPAATGIDEEAFERLGLHPRLELWRERARQLAVAPS
jgi:putative nucleotidyltransferase with HDIG domain